jgi:uncharacterized protein
MKLSKIERWILSNQYRILECVDAQQAESHRHAREALERGYEWYYDLICELVADGADVMTEAECNSYDEISDKTGIDSIFIDFPGFDGNYEGKYLGFAEFFCRARQAYEHLRKENKHLNSHMPTADLYERMLSAWNSSSDKLHLTRDDLIRITQAARHPDNR